MPATTSRRNQFLRVSLAVIAALALLVIGFPLVHLTIAAWNDRQPASQTVVPGVADDASRLNAARVRSIIDISADDATAIAQIRDAFARARALHCGIAVAGFRHSMGGQTIARDGIVLNMLSHNRIEVRGDVVHVQSGAVWRRIIETLDRSGRSVEVMQSDSPFSVGGSLSVNCHGWQSLHAPIASTVLAMTVMTPAGELVHCSRNVRPDLFSHVLGGYGVIGVILDADLRTVRNEMYAPARTLCDVASYESTFDRVVRANPSIGLAYGRISVAPASFLREAILTTFARQPGPVHTMKMSSTNKLERIVFRGSAGSAYGKTLRWQLERNLMGVVDSGSASRNEVMNGDIEDYIDRSSDSVDILQEYFVPRGKLAPFIDAIRPILLKDQTDLLNVTVRDVKRDDITALSYAREEVFAIVMFFHQTRSAEADRAMEKLTRELIDVALSNRGTYYLPYRLHATVEQFNRAYPMARDFAAAKHAIDPDGVLVNEWYLRYFPRQHGDGDGRSGTARE